MTNVRLIKPYIEYVDVEAEFQKIFESGVFTRGSHVNEFSKNLGSMLGTEFTFLTTSATTALWVSLRALNIGAGDEVAISDFSFPATANVVEDIGAKPVFIDVNLDTFNMNVVDLTSKISPRTKAVIFVDTFGNPTGLHEVKKVCEHYSIPLIEDAACALGSKEHGVSCGKIADIACFSFHPRKLLCTGEGGAITTDNKDLAGWLKSKLLHGASENEFGSLEFNTYGFNFRMSELQAVMGMKQISKLQTIISQRKASRDMYVSELNPLGFRAQNTGSSVIHNLQSLVFTVPDCINRDSLINHMKTREIETTIGTYCQSNLPYYKKKYDDVQPKAAHLEASTITFPCYQDFPIERVCQSIKTFCKPAIKPLQRGMRL